MSDAQFVLAVVIALGAAFAVASQSLFVRMGTEDGDVYEAVIVVMCVTVVVLLPIVAVYYYPDYGITRTSALSFVAAGFSEPSPGARCCTPASTESVRVERRRSWHRVLSSRRYWVSCYAVKR